MLDFCLLSSVTALPATAAIPQSKRSRQLHRHSSRQSLAAPKEAVPAVRMPDKFCSSPRRV
eukprot:1157601-Pelagomonas_calceolata.AAC.9